MPGEEIIPLSKAVVKGSQKALGETDKVKQRLAEMAKGSPEMKAAAESYARRIAIRQGILTRLYEPLAKWAGVSKSYFDSDFADDMADKIAEVPEENLTTAPVSGCSRNAGT